MSNAKRRSLILMMMVIMMIIPSLASAGFAPQDAPTGGATAPTQTPSSRIGEDTSQTEKRTSTRRPHLAQGCTRGYNHGQFRRFAKRVYRGKGMPAARKRHVGRVLRCHTSRAGRATSRRLIHRLQRLQWRRNHPWEMHWRRLPSSGKQWVLRTASCESGRNPNAVSGNGLYFGALQFGLSTWYGVGGRGNPTTASLKEQYVRGYRLMQRDGSGHWPVCG